MRPRESLRPTGYAGRWPRMRCISRNSARIHFSSPHVHVSTIFSRRHFVEYFGWAVVFSGGLIASCGGSTVGDGALLDAGSRHVTQPSADAASSPMSSESDGGACVIVAGRYDRSCAVDTDCVWYVGRAAVVFGDYCMPICVTCPGGAINARAAAQFSADVSMTPLGSGAIPVSSCGCIGASGPCCRSGQCSISCEPQLDAGPGG